MPDSRRHILFVIAGISAGTGTFCKSLGAGLRKFYPDQFKVSLLTFRPDAKFTENAVNFNDTFILSSEVHNDWRRAFDLPRGLIKLRQAVSAIQPDLIFTIGTFSNVATSLAISDRPIILSDHLNMTQRLKGAKFGAMTGWFMRRTYQDHLLVVASQELADDLRDNFGAKRTSVIPNGIDASVVRNRAQESAAPFPSPGTPGEGQGEGSSSNFENRLASFQNPHPSPLPEYRAREKSNYFISVGRLTAQKDIATLLRAFAIAKDRGMNQELVIAGDGEERVTLESLASELHIESMVHFLGHVSNPYPLIKNARALVLSSIWEGFAYVPIEAMALGVPVISTACPSGPVEILGNGEFGLLVPPGDPQLLADAMLEISSDDELHRHLHEKSLQRADQLSIENMVRAYREVFLSEMRD